MTPRRNPRNAQVAALRMLADELEAGDRELSPELAKAIDRELEDPGEDLSPEEYERVWATELRRRIAERKTGKDKSVNVAAVIAELRARLT